MKINIWKFVALKSRVITISTSTEITFRNSLSVYVLRVFYYKLKRF